MAASYPASVRVFTTKVAAQVISEGHVNDLQEEVAAIEQGLLNGLAHVITNASQPRAFAFHSTTQAIADSSWVVVNLDSEDLDVGGCHDLAINNARLTVPVGGGGLYLVCGTVTFAANTTGVRGARLKKNAGAVDLGAASIVPGASGLGAGSQVMVQAIAQLAAGDYVYLEALQNSGGPLNAGSAANRYLQNQLLFVKLW